MASLEMDAFEPKDCASPVLLISLAVPPMLPNLSLSNYFRLR